jgi:hypothetical protein
MTRKRLAAVVFAGLVLLAAGVGVRRWIQYRHDQLPELAVLDVQGDAREAAKVERLRGQGFARAASPDDEAVGALPVSLGQGGAPGWSVLAPGARLRLGSYLQAEAQSGVELSTAGHWYMALDGLGAMILEDARRNEQGTQHVLSVYLQKGTFRAKSANDNFKGYYLDISTEAATIHVFEGEIGIEVQKSGKGRMWLVSGRAVAQWKDGRSEELGLRGLEDL